MITVKMGGKCYLLCAFYFGLLGIASAQRGSSCINPNGNTAICTSIYECNIFVRALKNQNPSQIDFIKKSQCGYDTKPLVCCGNDIDFSTTRNPEEQPQQSDKPTGRTFLTRGSSVLTRSQVIPDRSTCGFQESDNNNQLEGFIYGGTETRLKEFPWLALLGYVSQSGRTLWSCGGTLISSRYVLTAAHCVTGAVVDRVGQLTYAKLGEHDKAKAEVCDDSGYCKPKPLIIPVESFTFHENYNPLDRTSSSDIAVVRLNQKVDYTEVVRPICLPEPDEASTSNEKLIAAGWGRTEKASSTVKLKVALPFVTKDECLNAFRTTRLRLSDSQICAGGEGGKDSCNGDSGGPLMRRSKSNPLQWYQEGIVSFGNTDCGIKGLPGVYTKVSTFLTWIHSHVKE